VLGDKAYGLIFVFSGSLELGKLIAVVSVGSFLGVAIRFWIGRHFGNQWLLPYQVQLKR
jgi:membrane protein DedA with SNARE-associated domain